MPAKKGGFRSPNGTQKPQIKGSKLPKLPSMPKFNKGGMVKKKGSC